jgi:hypothetical protein
MIQSKIKSVDTTIYTITKPIYYFLFFALYLLYFALFFGLFYVNPSYIRILTTIIHVLICAFLIIRFHPFRKHELKEFDSQIIFASAIVLFTNGPVFDALLHYLKQFIGSSVDMPFINKINNINNTI